MQVRRNVIYVIIDDGEQPLLVNPSRERFHNIKMLALEAGTIIWITAQKDSSAALNPDRGLISGFSRVSRSESESLRFLTIDVRQGIAIEREAILNGISDLLCASFGAISEGVLLKQSSYSIMANFRFPVSSRTLISTSGLTPERPKKT